LHEPQEANQFGRKDQFRVEGKTVLFTFGLLVANKGIEHVIEVLPENPSNNTQTSSISCFDPLIVSERQVRTKPRKCFLAEL